MGRVQLSGEPAATPVALCRATLNDGTLHPGYVRLGPNVPDDRAGCTGAAPGVVFRRATGFDVFMDPSVTWGVPTPVDAIPVSTQTPDVRICLAPVPDGVSEGEGLLPGEVAGSQCILRVGNQLVQVSPFRVLRNPWATVTNRVVPPEATLAATIPATNGVPYFFCRAFSTAANRWFNGWVRHATGRVNEDCRFQESLNVSNVATQYQVLVRFDAARIDPPSLPSIPSIAFAGTPAGQPRENICMPPFPPAAGEPGRETQGSGLTLCAVVTANLGRFQTNAFRILDPDESINVYACGFTATPRFITFPPVGGTAAVSVDASDSFCSYQFGPLPAWIQPVTQTTRGDSVINLRPQPNTGPRREAIISITGLGYRTNPAPVSQITITQLSGCSYTLGATSASMIAAGGTVNVPVTASDPACPWGVTGLPAWASVVTQSATSVQLRLEANNGPARSAVITIAGRPFTLNQEAGCSFTLSITSQQVSAAGGVFSVPFTSAQGCVPALPSGLPSWITAAAFSGSQFGYTVLANTGTARAASFSLLGQTFTVNQAGTQISTSSLPLRFVSLPPCRVLETRPEYASPQHTGVFGPPFLNAGVVRTLPLPQSAACAIPAAAKAYVVNVTLIPRPGGIVDFATLWAAGEPRPNVFTVRSPDGQIVANSQILAASADGSISIHTSHTADVLLDVSGYFTENPAVSNLAFYPLTPCRVIDTRVLYRPGAGPFGPPTMAARQTRSFRFPDSPDCRIPAGAAAYSVTLTVAPPVALPFLTAWPAGPPAPNISSINSFVGRTLANNIIVPASGDGSVSVFAFEQTDFLMDINGYFAPDNGTTGQFYFPVTQCRVYDTTGANAPQFGDDTVRTVNPQSGVCPGIPSTAQSYALNVTAVPNGSSMPFLTAYPAGQLRTNSSVLNAFEGQTVTAFTLIPAGTNGQIDLYTFRRTQVIVDIAGYFGR